MARAIASPRSEVSALANADLVGLWRCAEATAATNFADAGPNALTLTQNNSPGVGADPVTLAALGSRTFDGVNQYGSLSTNAYIADFTLLKGCSAFGWVKKTGTAVKGIVSYGGTGSSGAVNNALIELYAIGATVNLALGWMHSVNTFVSADSGIPLTNDRWYFVGAAREADPDNVDMVRVRFYVFEHPDGAADPSNLVRMSIVKNLTPPSGTTSARFALGARRAGALPWDGSIADAGLAKVALHEWWFREQFRQGVVKYNQTDMLDADVTSATSQSKMRCRIEDSDRTWRDLSALGPYADDHFKGASFSQAVDDARSACSVTLHRAAGKFNLAIEDRNSPHNKDAAGSYSPLLQGRRKARVEYVFRPSNRGEVEEWEWEGLLEGYIDDPDVNGDEIKLVILDGVTPLADMQIVTPQTYGNVAGTTVFDTTLQSIVNDSATTYGYLGDATPTLHIPTATGLTHNDFWAQGMSVYDKLSELTQHMGFDCRAVYDDVRHECRVTVYEPDRSTASTQWTWDESDYQRVENWRQTVSAVRNWCRVYYGQTAAKDARGEPIRSYQEFVDTTSIDKFGPLYCEYTEGDGSLIDTAAEALDLATVTIQELSDPIAWFSAVRPFHPFVEIADRIAFAADGTPTRYFSTSTEVAVIGVRHEATPNGITTFLEHRGLRAASTGTRRERSFPTNGAVLAPVRTLTAPTNLMWQGAVAGGVVTWAYPAGRTRRIAEFHEVHLGATSGFTPDTTDPSTTLAGVVRGTSFPLFGYLDADTLPFYAKVIAIDRFNNASPASTFQLLTAYYAAIVPSFRASRPDSTPTNNIGTTPAKVLCDFEEFDAGGTPGDYDNATNYRFTAPRPGTYTFSGQVEATVAAESLRAYLYVNGALEIPGGVVDDMGIGFIQQPIATVSGDIYLDIGDYVELWASLDDGLGGTRAIQFRTHFSGHLVGEWQ